MFSKPALSVYCCHTTGPGSCKNGSPQENLRNDRQKTHQRAECKIAPINNPLLDANAENRPPGKNSCGHRERRANGRDNPTRTMVDPWLGAVVGSARFQRVLTKLLILSAEPSTLPWSRRLSLHRRPFVRIPPL